MSATIAAEGRLAQDGRRVDTATGKAMAVGTLAVDVQRIVNRVKEPGTLWLGLVAFGELADGLAGMMKGRRLSVTGRLQQSAYTDKQGERRESWSCVVDAFPDAPAAREQRPAAQPAAQPEQHRLDDEIPF